MIVITADNTGVFFRQVNVYNSRICRFLKLHKYTYDYSVPETEELREHGGDLS